MNQRAYRPDIDGLRAIAVFSVLFHHLNAAWLPGGFIGVDLFFVISGYLITSQVYADIREGRFSIRRFYQRRINRIVPALVCVVLASWVAGVFLLSPADLIRLAKSSVFAMLGASNIFFWREYGNYFAGNATEVPLLHTWSLGVEEQFYLIWPLLVLLIFKLSRRHMVGVLMVLTLAALGVSEKMLGVFASASYYLLPSRFFELMIGGLLALWIDARPLESRRYADVFAMIGLALISGSLFFLDKSSSFPGINALWPCLGAMLLILSGNRSRFLSRILKFRLMVFVGLISYSLYLWHWPLIAYLHYTQVVIGVEVGAAVFFLSVLLAWLSWKFVENPMRRSGAYPSMPFSKVFLRRFVAPAGILLFISMAIVYTQGFPQRFDHHVAEFEQVLAAKPDVLRHGCHVPTALFDTLPSSTCKLGVDKPAFDGILIGDSFANHFSGLVDEMAKAQNLAIMDYTMDACPPILGFDNQKSRSYVVKCYQRNEAVFKMLAEHPYRLVIMAGSWPRVQEAEDQLIASIETVLRSGVQLTLILANSSIDRAESCPVRRLMYGSSDTCEGRRQEPPEYFSRIRARFPQVNIIDPNQVICSGEICQPVLAGVPLYRDGVHLNDVGSRLIGQSLMSMGVTLSFSPIQQPR